MRHTTKTKFRRLRMEGLNVSREHSAVKIQLSRLRRADRVAAASEALAGLETRLNRANSRALRLVGA